MTSTAGSSVAAAIACPDCGTAIAPSLTSCPACHRLVHATTLRELAERAADAARAGDLAGELSAWRTSLELLPPDSRQFRTISDRVAALSKAADAAETTIAPPPSTGAWKWLVALGPDRLAPVEVQVPGRPGSHEGQAAAPGADEEHHALLDAARPRRLLDDVGVAVCVRLRDFDLHPRDGARRGAPPIRHSCVGADVHSGRRRTRPPAPVTRQPVPRTLESDWPGPGGDLVPRSPPTSDRSPAEARCGPRSPRPARGSICSTSCRSGSWMAAAGSER